MTLNPDRAATWAMPLPSYRRRSRRWFASPFNCQRDGVPSAEAQRRDPALRIAPAHFIKERHQDARAACADRMSQGNRSAVHIYFFGIQFELFHDGDGLNGERFVQLD